MREKTITNAIGGAFDVSKGRARYSTIRERVSSASRVDGIHLCQLIASMLIASIGLNINSTEAVIGAMLICPLMGSVLAISYAISTMDRRLRHRCLGGFVLQCVICLVTSTLYFTFSPLSTETSELLTNSSATIWDVLIALVGGFAGALGLSRRREPGTLVAGVAVATALMPPLCSAGFGLAHGDGLLALSAVYEFLINVVFIGFGAAIVLVWLHVPLDEDLDGDGKVTEEERAEVEHELHELRMRLIAGMVIFAIPCLYFSWQVVQQSVTENGTVFEVVDEYSTEMVTKELDVVCPDFEAYRIGVEDSYNEETDKLEQQIVAEVETSEELSPVVRKQVEALIRLHVEEVDQVSFEVTDD